MTKQRIQTIKFHYSPATGTGYTLTDRNGEPIVRPINSKIIPMPQETESEPQTNILLRLDGAKDTSHKHNKIATKHERATKNTTPSVNVNDSYIDSKSILALNQRRANKGRAIQTERNKQRKQKDMLKNINFESAVSVQIPQIELQPVIPLNTPALQIWLTNKKQK
ncbi:MAG: hypothetical protein J5714_04505 [Alphaproteobacteria bacterium]|nr:hypothetical protein [Alphaproteobacteria bacterium]